MKKLFLMAITTVMSIMLIASVDNTKEKSRHELMLKNTGGIIIKEGQGKVVVVNSQKKFSSSEITECFSIFKEKLKVNIDVRSGKWSFGDMIPKDANIAIFIVDDSTLPMSLIAPEAKWGVINVNHLSKATSFKKEIFRVAIATIGAGVSQYKVSPMQPIFTEEDFDSIINCSLTVDAMIAMKTNLEKAGVTKHRITSYKKACYEGWAPAPTNKYQKAIWEKVHAAPKNPMKIEFDPKKGR